MNDEDLISNRPRRYWVERRVCALVAANLCLQTKWVKPESSFIELGADRLDFYSIVLDLEEAFKLPIPDEDSRRFATVKDAIDWILNHDRQRRFSIPSFKHRPSDRVGKLDDAGAFRKEKTSGQVDEATNDEVESETPDRAC